jgi:glycosyltransferase involved in cell wall biosynthesis
MPEIINSCTFPVHLLVVGGGTDEYTIYLKSIVEELNLQSNVSFTGFVTNPSEIIAGLDLLVAPSSRDAFGRSIVESMLQATPVLVANKGGHLEIVEDELNGSVYMANCQNSFIEKTLRLSHDNSFREALVVRALEESRSKYSKNTFLLKVGRIYKSVLKH